MFKISLLLRSYSNEMTSIYVTLRIWQKRKIYFKTKSTENEVNFDLEKSLKSQKSSSLKAKELNDSQFQISSLIKFHKEA